ncbi:hypothetical protein Bhyg_02363, partial [Pseudolycoriella hygida]
MELTSLLEWDSTFSSTTITQYTSAYAFLNFDEESLRGIEEFMRNDFSDVMIGSGETTKDYLGYYWRCQDKFKLVGGQISMISNIAKECRKLYETEINKLNTNEDALCTQVIKETIAD